MKITPVLMVEKIEPSLGFWVERIGFQKTAEVPEDGALTFVILQKDGAELMLQTRASVTSDMPVMAQRLHGQGIGLFIEVADFDDLKQRIEGAEVLMEERTTFYGMREIVVKEPGGFAVCFASPIDKG